MDKFFKKQVKGSNTWLLLVPIATSRYGGMILSPFMQNTFRQNDNIHMQLIDVNMQNSYANMRDNYQVNMRDYYVNLMLNYVAFLHK